MRHVHRSRGFTLVELLIVVAIIGILSAVLTPQFLNARKVAADRAAEAYAHNVYTAVQAHIAEKGTVDMLASQTTPAGTGTIGCTDGWAGSNTNFSVPKPAKSLGVTQCLVTVGPGYELSVAVTYEGGTKPSTTLPAN